MNQLFVIRWWFLLYLLAWTVSHSISDTNLDPAGDMLENFAWGQDFSWGQSKHPPLIAWITYSWFSILPNIDPLYHLLAYLASALGLLGVYRFGMAYGLREQSLPAVLLLSIAIPYSTIAVKFNANTVLLMIWPWVAWAWIRAIQSPGFMTASVLGFLAALAMMGKYYSAAFLLSLGIATLCSPAGRSWLTSRLMPVTVISGLLVLAPHLSWLYQHDFVTFTYIQDKHETRGDPVSSLIKFVFLPVTYWLIPLLLCCWFYASGETFWQRCKQFASNLLLVWLPNKQNIDLFVVAFGAYFITLIIGASGYVVLASPWAIPLGFAFTLYWLSNLQHRAADLNVIQRKTATAFSVWLGLIVLLSPVYAWQQGTSGADNFYKPRALGAEAVLKEWQRRMPEQPLYWVASSDWPESSLLAFYGDPNIYALESPPNEFPATLVPLDDWDEHAGVLLCVLGYDAKPHKQACMHHAEVWLKKESREIDYFDVSVARTGLRFPLHQPYSYRAYIVLPLSDR